MKPNVEINKIYHYFQDGKVKPSRRITVRILDIIPFEDIDQETFDMWLEEREDCDWLYARETDYFIKAIHERDDTCEVYFVRTIDDTWFGLGWMCGILDIDGELNKMIL